MTTQFRVGEWTVYPQLGEITREGIAVYLKPRVMELLAYFARHPGEVLCKERLLDTLWKDTFVTENTLMNAISELRKALGDEPREPAFITTHSKRGYRLIAPVAGTPPDVRCQADYRKQRVRLAVVPFASHGPDRGDKLAETLTEMLVTALATSKSVCGISLTSASLCNRESAILPELVRRLNVQRVLEGSVICVADRFRVAVRLYDEDDDVLWGELLEQPAGDQQASLDELTQRIVRRVESS